MKKFVLLFLSAVLILSFGCDKEDEDTPFTLLTAHVWTSDSLLVNGQDASGPDGMLVDFMGDAKFNTDGTGTFGNYQGTWRFSQNETQLVITTEELPLPLTALIEELTKTDLKISTAFPDPLNPGQSLLIRMTFKAK
ncbi:MAG: hypothetical protein K0B09_06235 [Bacteroidales bacterium]|nr:hypothetical protein [Bacteroidales bacterium]